MGVAPGLIGVPLGEATGDETGLAAGLGDAAGGLGGSGFCGSHAPNTTVETARTVVNINDLLIVNTPDYIRNRGLEPSASTDIRSRTDA